jgi:hypothetical protein
MSENTKYVTKTASVEDDAGRRVMLEMHIVEAMEIHACIDYYCRNAKQRFDSSPHQYRMRDIITGLREIIGNVDPEWGEMFGKSLPPFVEPPSIHEPAVREIHHHHYHEKPSPKIQGHC